MLKSLLALSISFFLLTPYTYSQVEKTGNKNEFKNDIKAEEDLNETFLNYQQELSKNPNSSRALYNLALVELKQGQLGWALAHIERSSYLAPLQFKNVKLRNLIIDKLIDVKREPPQHQVAYLNRLMDFIPGLLISTLAGLCLGLFFLFWALSYRKSFILIQSNKAEKNKMLIFLAISLFLIPIYCLKISNFNNQWVCVISDVSTLYSGPGLKHREVGKIKSGNCLRLKNSKKDWVAVADSENNYGWLSTSDIYLARGRKLTLKP